MAQSMQRSDEYFDRREQLLEKTQEKHQERERQHQVLLEAAASGEEAIFEEYTTATIGNAELTVQTQIKGSVARKLDTIYDENLPPGRLLDVYVDVLSSQTESIKAEHNGATVELDDPRSIRQFFRNYLDNHDIEAAGKLAMDRVIEEPCELEDERRQEAIESFPVKGRSRSDRARAHRNRR